MMHSQMVQENLWENLYKNKHFWGISLVQVWKWVVSFELTTVLSGFLLFWQSFVIGWVLSKEYHNGHVIKIILQHATKIKWIHLSIHEMYLDLGHCIWILLKVTILHTYLFIASFQAVVFPPSFFSKTSPRDRKASKFSLP